jgi:hypothetical protein
MKSKTTVFEFGFNLIGARVSLEGEDLVGVFKAPADMPTPTLSGTPVNISEVNEGEVEISADGAKPEFLLFSKVAERADNTFFYEGIKVEDTVEPGNPVTIVPFKSGAIVNTALLAEGYTPAVGDNLYFAGGKFTATDPTGDASGVVVGVVKQVVNGRARVLLK